MENSNDPLDRLISETLETIHGRALNDGLANTYRTLDNVGAKKNITARQIQRRRYRTSSLFAFAASFLLIVGIAIPAFISSQGDDGSDRTRQVQTADKISTTTNNKITTDPENENDVTSTSSPSIFEPGGVTTTTKNKSLTQVTAPFNTSPTTATTAPPTIAPNARVSYSNTRANSIPLDGATISGDVYIFYDDPNVDAVHWWLDQPGVWDKALATRAGSKQPQDFNYRIDGVVPRSFDTSQLSVGEHTMGIRTQTISPKAWPKYEIKFYVTR